MIHVTRRTKGKVSRDGEGEVSRLGLVKGAAVFKGSLAWNIDYLYVGYSVSHFNGYSVSHFKGCRW